MRTLTGQSSGRITESNSAGSRQRPGPFVRAALRAPAWLYDNGLGWVLGQRFLCLDHLGRKTGKRYRTVLEVIGTNAEAAEYLVLSGFGRSSDWYRNIGDRPANEVTVGCHAFWARHRILTEPEAEAALAEYERAHRWLGPVVHQVLSRLLGWRYDGSRIARQRLVRELPVVAFRPRTRPDASDPPIFGAGCNPCILQ